jgi:ATP-dependent protease ClpP protease subunit
MAKKSETTEQKEPKIFSKKKGDKTKLKTHPQLFEKTQTFIVELSKELKCPVLTYFKPPSGNIWAQDLYAIMQCLKEIGKVDTLALYIRSDGGNGMVSLRIIHLLRSFVKHLILLAPSECASAATMLALGCDSIYMGPLSSLSPVDSSMVHQLSPVDKLTNKVSVSFDELSRVVKLWREENEQISESENMDNPYKHLYQYIHPLVFGAIDRHSSLSIRICKEILGYHINDEEKIDKITSRLNHDYPAHGYPITIREARNMGLPVKDLSPKSLDILNELQLLYSEITEDQITDYDSSSYHDNTVYSIIEMVNLQVIYKHDFDKFYREIDKRYIILNDKSGWVKSYKDKKSIFKTERLYL